MAHHFRRVYLVHSHMDYKNGNGWLILSVLIRPRIPAGLWNGERAQLVAYRAARIEFSTMSIPDNTQIHLSWMIHENRK